MNENELMVTIPLDEYKDLIYSQRELDNLINYIFGISLTGDGKLDFDEQAAYLLEVYLKNIWSYTYNKKINESKKQNIDKGE